MRRRYVLALVLASALIFTLAGTACGSSEAPPTLEPTIATEPTLAPSEAEAKVLRYMEGDSGAQEWFDLGWSAECEARDHTANGWTVQCSRARSYFNPRSGTLEDERVEQWVIFRVSDQGVVSVIGP